MIQIGGEPGGGGADQGGVEPDEYEVESALTTPKVSPGGPVSAPRRPAVSQFERRKLPKHPLWTGVWKTPLSRGALPRIVLFSAWSVVVVALVIYAVSIYQQSYGAVMAVMAIAVAAILAAFLVMTTSATWLTLLTQTSDGVDTIDDWPGLMFIDWMFDGACVVSAAALCSVPGWLAAQLIPNSEIRPLIIGASCLLMFPLMLLSMLDAESMFCPLTRVVVGSLVRSPMAWIVFSLQSVLLAGGLAVAFVFAAGFSPLLTYGLVPLAVVVSFWYFRLLGRLAWVIGESSPLE